MAIRFLYLAGFIGWVSAAFFAGVNHERTGCAAIQTVFGCVPNYDGSSK